ncbi:dolichyl-phosphate-mannose--protein mannosyltransferase [Agromyces atrinae]|uniref:Polyprenol-phosphate-mannose--protein mannosyltransferase n=1 Tax=Agromyces atrinae TaxID=592376 RepID=A0A4Q2LZT0_9MICO|nr:phospholipid carrier-dependent glycosyltransferase [Agromyces atrinae]NYD68777.1 dolichyl-phosphate-mannose--protein O-mannosyl transferase [Agromyces atrinae]RXZ85074.1 phospholipid carrier-dependent glycosyltransferase [Agromyces atrinae]RXZ85845.1 phospholipid carrier-dependent glycosyltransferase [Agromyces atrinae]
MHAEGATGSREATTTDDEAPESAPAAPAPRGTRLDAWWARVLGTPARRRFWYWAGPIAVTLLAGILRFWNLGHPHTLVFDETYYVKDAWTLIGNGYESRWPEDADAGFAAGDTDTYLDEPSYVVHPPLGKWMIGLGMAAFGAGDPFWWRATTALAGTIAVLLVSLIARRLFGSTIVAVIAGLLFAIDGNAIVMSRVALLDTWVMFFALLGFGCVLLDREWHATRLAARLAERRARGVDPAWGPVLWWRPWLLAAGIAFGATTAVKWSGLYFLAAFGIYLVVVDALARRRAGLPFWITSAILRQGPATFLLVVPIAAVVYLASWTGWLVTDGGYYRDWATTTSADQLAGIEWLPAPLQSLWHYHQEAYKYHVGLSTPHPWQSHPLGWLVMERPTNMYYVSLENGDGGCTVDACVQTINGIGNPLIWWGAAAAVLYLLYRLVRWREWQVGLVLVGLAAGYLPWLLYPDRTMFTFYTIAFQPYTMLALAGVLGIILGRRDDLEWRRARGIGVVGVYLAFAVLLSAFFYPLWTGTTIPFTFWQLHIWLPGWR